MTGLRIPLAPDAIRGIVAVMIELSEVIANLRSELDTARREGTGTAVMRPVPACRERCVGRSIVLRARLPFVRAAARRRDVAIQQPRSHAPESCRRQGLRHGD